MLKRIFSVVLIGSQLNLAMAVAATPETSRTPEFNLVESVIALQGEKLSDQDLQTQFKGAIAQYAATAPADGQQDRLESALVDLGVYTPAQASSFMADAQGMAAKAGSAQEISQEMTRLGSSHPAGAQFSACSFVDAISRPAAFVAISAVIAGFTIVGIGYDRSLTNPTCTSNIVGTALDSNDNVITVYGPTTCTQQNYYPYKNQGQTWMQDGGLAALAGGLLFAALVFNGCN